MNKITNAFRDLKLIEGDDKIRAQKCGQEITVILERYDCAIVPELRMVGPQISHGIKIVSKPRIGKDG